MEKGSGLGKSQFHPAVGPEPELNLLVRLEPWPRVFFRNLADVLLFRRPPRVALTSPPAPFWHDVFVSSRLPWHRFLESALYHVLMVAAVSGFSQLWMRRPQPLPRRPFDSADVIYYPASEYLPPLDTGKASLVQPRKGEPEYAKQPIISVPPEPDNRTQTIVTPPDVRLDREVPLPNIVAWAQTQVPVPLAATERSAAQLTLPALPVAVVAPPPDLNTASARQHSPSLTETVIAPPPEVTTAPVTPGIQAPEPAIIEPPPEVRGSAHRLGDINIGHTEVVAPAPQLPMGEQRALAARAHAAWGGAGPQVVPPPPSIQGTGGPGLGGQLIALGIHPVAPNGPIQVLAGNRRGTFAATPEGKPGAPGTPDLPAESTPAGGAQAGQDGGHGNGGGSGHATNDVLPQGLYVGSGPGHAATSSLTGPASDPASQPQASANSSLVASAVPPRAGVLRRPASPVADSKASELDRKVFGERRFYSLTLNMPNLNSAGGSWVVRFAELKEDGDQGELLAPQATRKVDPAYPLELMRKRVEGTVTLYAVIHSDGSVGDVRVLRGVDEQLDEYARAALARWQFRPAMKNGSPVALEAVVMIPFRANRNPW